MAKKRKTSAKGLTAEILKAMLIAGMFVVAASSPFFLTNFLKKKSFVKRKITKRQIDNVFSYLRRKNLIKFERRGKQIYISLTSKGKQRAGKYQIDSLKITPPKIWDGKWRLISFDVAESKKMYREVLRGKIKQLGLAQLQRSVWLTPYDCQKEINLFREFLGLSKKELMYLVIEKLEDEKKWKKEFGLK